MQMIGDVPRRIRLDHNTSAELAIRAASSAVESAGCHPLLTDAVNLLSTAREKVADYVELPETQPQRDDLAQLIRPHVQAGKFKLSSGGFSSFYVDLRIPSLSSSGQRLMGSRMAILLQSLGLRIEAIGGPELAAVPIVSAMLAHFIDMRGFVVRKERKDHGLNKLIDGDLRKGDRFAVIDDVATSGASLMRAIGKAEHQCEAKCVVALCVIDRQEGATEHLSAFGVTLKSLYKINELATK